MASHLSSRSGLGRRVPESLFCWVSTLMRVRVRFSSNWLRYSSCCMGVGLWVYFFANLMLFYHKSGVFAR